MKGKILKSQYNPGWDSWVLKQTKYGTFNGEAILHPEDEDIDNSFDGCRIAEFRADLQAYKEKAKWLRQRAIGARIAWKSIYKVLDDIEYKLLTDEVEMLENQAQRAKEYYERMKDYEPIYIKNLIKNRRETRERIENKKDAD